MMTAPTRIVALVAMIVTLVACAPEPTAPEQALRAWVDAMRAAAEARDAGAIMDRISASYADGRGNDRDDIERMLRGAFLRYRQVALVARIDDIRVIADTAAEIDMTLAMAGTKNTPIGFGADAYRVEMELELVGRDWQLLAARWASSGEQLE